MGLLARAIAAHVIFLMAVIGLYLLAANTAFNLGKEPDLRRHIWSTPKGKLRIVGLVLLITATLSGVLALLLWISRFQSAFQLVCAIIFFLAVWLRFRLIGLKTGRRLVGAVGAAGALVILSGWYFIPSWWTLDITAAVLGWALLCAFSRQTLKTAIILAAAIVLFDAVAVFGTGMMVKFAEQAVVPFVTDGAVSAAPPIMFLLPLEFTANPPYIGAVGVGDVLFPGMLVMAASREAMAFKVWSVAFGAFAGYAGGFTVGVLIGMLTASSQPLAIYLCPAVTAGIVIPAWRAGVLGKIVNPPPDDEEEDVESPEDEASFK